MTVLLLVLLFQVLSCVPWRTTEDPRDVHRRPEGVRLEVRNQHFNEVVVYAMPDGVRERLAAVPGNDTRTMDLPARLLLPPGGLRLMVSPIGSREVYLSGEIFSWSEGDTVVMVVAGHLRMSFWYLRR